MEQSLKSNKLQSWLLASRPKTLLASVIPIMIGSAVAVKLNKFNLLPALIALLCSVLIQVATNFVNDLYDYLQGTDNLEERLGPPRALASGFLSPKEMKIGIYLTFGLAFFLGLYLVYHAGWEILVIGILSLVSGYAYTAGPYPLAYNGLGDIFVFIFFGLVGTIGTFYVQALEISAIVVYASVPAGLLITNILVVNNYRDRVGDKDSNKRTLAVIFSSRFVQLQYIISIIISYLIPVIFFFYFSFSIFSLIVLLTLPIAFILVKMLFTLEGKALNQTLELTAKFGFIFSVLFSLGIVL